MSKKEEKTIEKSLAEVKSSPPVTIFKKGEQFEVSSGACIVFCYKPGLRRSGKTHKGLAVYRKGKLSEAEISELTRDAFFVVVRVS